MADTGYSGDMAASTEGVDLEMHDLIKAVVERGPRRKDALSKRFEAAGPQLLQATQTDEVSGHARPQDEINSLMDEIKRNAEARSAQKIDLGASAASETSRGLDAALPDEKYAPASKPWLEEAALAQQTMMANETGDDDAATAPQQGFGINPFAKKTAAAGALGAASFRSLASRSNNDTDHDAFVREADNGFVDPPASVDEHQEADFEDTAAIAPLYDDRHAEYAAALTGPASALEDETPASAPMSAAAIAALEADNDESASGPPIWLAMGIPVAAVSIAALVAGVHVVREAGADDVPIEAASLAPMTVTYAEAVEPPAAGNQIEALAGQGADQALTLASAPAAAPEARNLPERSLPDARTMREPAEAASRRPAENLEVSAPVPRAPAEPAPADLPRAIAPIAPSIKPALPSPPAPNVRVSAPVPTRDPETAQRRSSAPERAGLSNVPSLKPQLASLPRRSATPLRASPAIFRPSGTLPVRVFEGRFERGSAALVVNTVAANMGDALDRTQQNWLARDMERVLDREIDGRNVSLRTDRGNRIGVQFEHSAQDMRRMPVARERSVAALPDQMVLEGGWYAVRKNAPLRPTPSVSGTFSNRTVNKDTLIERMATVTDRHGDRWYLMGQRGVAIGYMSPADLIIAGAVRGPLGLPYQRQLGDVVQDTVEVFTRCRTVFVGPLGGAREKLDVCRNSKGNWIGANGAQPTRQHAEAARPEPIVLASTVGENPELAPFETKPVRKSMAPKLVYGQAGQTVKQTLADGRDVEMTLGPKFETTRTLPVMRLEALGRIDRSIRLDARWMRVPGGTRLRATPDYITQMNVGAVPSGAAIETIGIVENDRGEDWVLVGRKGVGFGYVPRQDLMPLAGSTALKAVSSEHIGVMADLVETVADCRTVDYTGAGLNGTFTACQQPDGQWSLSADPALRQLVDIEPSSRIAP